VFLDWEKMEDKAVGSEELAKQDIRKNELKPTLVKLPWVEMNGEVPVMDREGKKIPAFKLKVDKKRTMTGKFVKSLTQKSKWFSGGKQNTRRGKRNNRRGKRNTCRGNKKVYKKHHTRKRK
jgi:hypothetical protein